MLIYSLIKFTALSSKRRSHKKNRIEFNCRECRASWHENASQRGDNFSLIKFNAALHFHTFSFFDKQGGTGAFSRLDCQNNCRVISIHSELCRAKDIPKRLNEDANRKVHKFSSREYLLWLSDGWWRGWQNLMVSNRWLQENILQRAIVGYALEFHCKIQFPSRNILSP